jgi:pimeloyl-ACP methyl ester carboxylesterase
MPRQLPQSPHALSLATPDGPVRAARWTPSAPLAGAAPILLLHDSLGCVALWRGFPQTLAQESGRDVVAYDRRGFGASSARTDRLGRHFVREEGERTVPALLDALGWARVVLVGHSVGGGMAVEAAAALGGRVAAVVTIAAQAFVEEITLSGVREAEAGLRTPDGLARLARVHGDKALWVLDSWTKTWLSPEFADYSLDAALEKVSAPLLAIHGERDEYATLAQPRRIAERAPRGRMRIIEGVGHLPHRECEGGLAKMIAELLQEPPAD